MTEKQINIPSHSGVTPCEDGKLRRSSLILCGSISNPVVRKEKYMNNKPKRVLLRVSSILMLLIALPMLLWCLKLIDNAALDYTYAGAGCLAAAIVYAFSMVTAIAGLAFVGRLHRHRRCRTLAYIQLAAGVLLVYPLHSYAALTLLPLFLLTILYQFVVGWREKRDSEQQ